jgi:hypothetical protein
MLNAEVSKIQNLLKSKHPGVAIEPLNVLIERIKWMTFNNYEVTDASELTQQQVVDDILSISKKLSSK